MGRDTVYRDGKKRERNGDEKRVSWTKRWCERFRDKSVKILVGNILFCCML